MSFQVAIQKSAEAVILELHLPHCSFDFFGLCSLQGLHFQRSPHSGKGRSSGVWELATARRKLLSLV